MWFDAFHNNVSMYYAQLLLPDFSLIVCGYLICRFTALNRTVWEQVDSLVFYFLFPVLLFHSIVRSPLDLGAASSLIGAALCMVGACIAVTYSLARLPGVQAADFASTAQIAFRFNSFIALALAERLAGKEGLLLIAVIIGVCVPLCNIGAIWPMARNSNQGFLKALVTNPLVIGTAGGLLANVLGFSIPQWAEPTVTRIGQASLALGLMAAGAGMQLGRMFNTRSKRTMGFAVLVMRHLAMPLLAWCMVRLFGLNTTQATMLLVFSALPTASSCYVLASRMGYDGSFVAGLVTLSTVLGALSLPFALQFLR
jgi:malonate transporter and related proteins